MTHEWLIQYIKLIFLIETNIILGWWLYHCHFLQHLFNGMSVVFHIGQDSDLPPTPKNFPKCGNFEPSILRNNPVPRGEL